MNENHACSNQGDCVVSAQNCHTCSCHTAISGDACQCDKLSHAFFARATMPGSHDANYAFLPCSSGKVTVLSVWALQNGGQADIARYGDGLSYTWLLRSTSSAVEFYTRVAGSAATLSASVDIVEHVPFSPRRWVHIRLVWGYDQSGEGSFPILTRYDTSALTGQELLSSVGNTRFCAEYVPVENSKLELGGGDSEGTGVADFRIWHILAGVDTDPSSVYDANLAALLAVIDSNRHVQIPIMDYSLATLPRQTALPFLADTPLNRNINLQSYLDLLPALPRKLVDRVGHVEQADPSLIIDVNGFYWTSPAGAGSTPHPFIVRPVAARCLNACSNKGECCDGKCLCASGFSGDDCSTSSGSLVAAPAAPQTANLSTPATVGSVLGGVAGFAVLALVFVRVAKSRLSHTLLVDEKPAVDAQGLSASAAASTAGTNSL